MCGWFRSRLGIIAACNLSTILQGMLRYKKIAYIVIIFSETFITSYEPCGSDKRRKWHQQNQATAVSVREKQTSRAWDQILRPPCWVKRIMYITNGDKLLPKGVNPLVYHDERTWRHGTLSQSAMCSIWTHQPVTRNVNVCCMKSLRNIRKLKLQEHCV